MFFLSIWQEFQIFFKMKNFSEKNCIFRIRWAKSAKWCPPQWFLYGLIYFFNAKILDLSKFINESSKSNANQNNSIKKLDTQRDVKKCCEINSGKNANVQHFFLQSIINIVIQVIFPNIITYLDRTFKREQNGLNFKIQ